MRELRRNLILAAASVLVTVAALEFLTRSYYLDFYFGDRVRKSTELSRAGYPARHDPLLGWIPRAGARSVDTMHHATVTILDGATRSNGDRPAVQPVRPLILAVGNSFVFGDEVSDHETWPAILERQASVRTINGGVFGYGVDQTAIRARMLADEHSPDMLILGLIPDDIRRNELSMRNGVRKPFFLLLNDTLELRGVPVPEPEPEKHSALDRLKGALSYSLLVHKIMSKLAPTWWLHARRGASIAVHRDGEAISCRLITEVNEKVKGNGIHFIVLLQYPRFMVTNDAPTENGVVTRLKACLQKSDVPVLDTLPHLKAAAACDSRSLGKFFTGDGGHMSFAGNEFTAKLLRRAVELTFGKISAATTGEEGSCVPDRKGG